MIASKPDHAQVDLSSLPTVCSPDCSLDNSWLMASLAYFDTETKIEIARALDSFGQSFTGDVILLGRKEMLTPFFRCRLYRVDEPCCK